MILIGAVKLAYHEVHMAGQNKLTLSEILDMALAAPAGTIMHATYKVDDNGVPVSFEMEEVNGQKPAEA